MSRRTPRHFPSTTYFETLGAHPWTSSDFIAETVDNVPLQLEDGRKIMFECILGVAYINIWPGPISSLNPSFCKGFSGSKALHPQIGAVLSSPSTKTHP